MLESEGQGGENTMAPALALPSASFGENMFPLRLKLDPTPGPSLTPWSGVDAGSGMLKPWAGRRANINLYVPETAGWALGHTHDNVTPVRRPTNCSAMRANIRKAGEDVRAEGGRRTACGVPARHLLQRRQY
eukprot:gene15676-biopygen15759